MWPHRDMKIQIPHYLSLTRISFIAVEDGIAFPMDYTLPQ